MVQTFPVFSYTSYRLLTFFLGIEMRKTTLIALTFLIALITNQAIADLPIPLRQGMPYSKARAALIDSGWQAEDKASRAAPSESSAEATSCGSGSEFDDRMCREFEEYDGCGHFCAMYFIDEKGNRLVVGTDHNDHFEASILTGFVKNWSIVKPCDKNSGLC
jgi:hypothetical protein